jgi:Leucine-rich repeat (LRR) protein
LSCAKNKIAQLPDQLQALRNLRELDVIYNVLTRLPPMERLEHIVRLDLRYNRLERLPALAAMTHLKELHAGFNRLLTLGDVASVLPAGLMILDLRDNRLQEIPASLTHLTHLERLELSNNDISALPPELGLLHHLKAIVVDGNPLRSLRRDIVRRGTRAILEHLRLSACSHCRMQNGTRQTLTGAIFLLLFLCCSCSSRLDEGSLAKQDEPESVHLRQVEERHATASVQASGTFSLAEQGLEVIPEHMWQPSEGTGRPLGLLYRVRGKSLRGGNDRVKPPFPSLSLPDSSNLHGTVLFLSLAGAGVERLDLSKNKLRDLPARVDNFAGTLTSLSLAFNQLDHLSGAIGLLQRLTVLDLRRNRLTALPDELVLLSHLRDLALGFNRFVTLPACVGDLRALETLVINDNQLVAIDVNLLAQLPVLGCLDVSNNAIQQVRRMRWPSRTWLG